MKAGGRGLSWAEPAVQALAWAALGWAAWLLWGQAQALLGFPYQVDWAEGAPLRSALALAEGRNPWSPQHLAQDGSIYGVGYPWLAAALLPRHWMTLSGLRALNLGLLLLSALSVGAMARRLGADGLSVAAAALLCFGGTLFSVTPLARGDALAMLGLLGPLALAFAAPRSRFALALAAALGALGVLAKSYAGLSMAWVLAYLWIQGERRAAVFFGAAWLGALALGLGLAAWAYPGSERLLTAAIPPPGARYLSWSWLALQNKVYLREAAWPLALLLPLLAWRRPWSAPARACGAVLLISLAVLQLLLGRNKGAILTYYFQILHPVAALLLLALAAGRGRAVRLICAAGLAIAALLTARTAAEPAQRLRQAELRPWQALVAMADAAQRPMLPQLLTSVATRLGQGVEDNGHTRDLTAYARRHGLQDWSRALEAHAAAWSGARARGQAGLLVLKREGPQAPSVPGYAHQGLLCLQTPANVWEHRACFDVYQPRSR